MLQLNDGLVCDLVCDSIAPNAAAALATGLNVPGLHEFWL